MIGGVSLHFFVVTPHGSQTQAVGMEKEDGSFFIRDRQIKKVRASVHTICSKVTGARGLKFCMAVPQRDAVGALDQNFEILSRS